MSAVSVFFRGGENGSRKGKTGCFEKPGSWGSWGVVGVPEIDIFYGSNHGRNKEKKEMLMLMLVCPVCLTMLDKLLQGVVD